jgi:FMN phosphatase YigB (HAD superfamily)
VMVGDRLDYDVRPAKRSGMRAIWMLRGEAPDDPTPEQLSEADAAIHTLEELPAALERLSTG